DRRPRHRCPASYRRRHPDPQILNTAHFLSKHSPPMRCPKGQQRRRSFMFERQIGYDLNGSKQRGRSPYFGFSVCIVSLLFATFLVASIFADDISLSGEGLEMTSMLAPTAVEPAVAEPERPQTPAA